MLVWRKLLIAVAGRVAGIDAVASGLAGLSAAATIALLNLSLVLALGALAATPLGGDALPTALVAAFVAATIGGFLVAALVRTRGEICGPASSIIVIYAALGADLAARAGPHATVAEVWAALSLAVVMMGLIVTAAGWLRLAAAIKFMPTPVSAGFVTGIGVAIFWSQLGPLLGLEAKLSQYGAAGVLEHLKPASLLVGAAAMVSMWTYPKITRRGQPALAALVVGTAVYHLMSWLYGPAALGPTLGTIAPAATAASTATTLWNTIGASWLLSTGFYVMPYAAFLALQAIMNTAVTSVALAEITGVRADVDRTLKVQGAANILCGALGALPVTTVASMSLPAARMKGATAIVPAASCVILFAAVLLAGDALTHVPVAVLAAILMVNGAGMIDRWARGLARRAWRDNGKDVRVICNLAIVAAVAAAFFFGSVPLALLVGAVLAMVLLAVDVSGTTTFDSPDVAGLASTRVWPAEQAQWLVGARSCIAVLRPRGVLFFGTADQLATRLEALGAEIRYCVLDLSRLTTLDATGCQMMAAAAKKLAAGGKKTILAGLSPSDPRAQELIALGLTQPAADAHWFDDLDHALEWVEAQLLSARWPDVAMDAPVELADTLLTKGLSTAELDELRSCLTRIDADEGPLFSRGAEGTSLYVIDRGVVEIRIGDEAGGKTTRLAAFGPGSLFGEIAMMTSAERTANAICVKAAQLYELKREAMEALQGRSPTLYARVLANLNTHLANRLVVSTGIVQAHR